jgi:hypothetical protein
MVVGKMYPTRQAYAPTPHSYIPNTALSATINLDEVRAEFTATVDVQFIELTSLPGS